MAAKKWLNGDKVAVRIRPEIKGSVIANLASTANHGSELLYQVRFDQINVYPDALFPGDAIITIEEAARLLPNKQEPIEETKPKAKKTKGKKKAVSK